MKSPTRLILSFSLIVPMLGGCVTSKAYEQPARVYETAKPATNSSLSQQQLDALLAPIALYPDTLLSHVLIASTYPLEIVEADRWVKNNPRYKGGEEAVKAVENKNWDPSVQALVAFPDVLQRMSEDLDWTQQLGDAFLDDEGRVMDSIQNLRNKAYASGNLRDTDHVKVVREERVIYIEPAVERVVYVPVYDTRIVYGPWWWPDYPPVYWHRYSHQVYFSGSFYWGPSVHIGSGFHYSSCHWSSRRVVIVDHHHYNDYYHHRHNYYRSARHWNHNPVHRRGVAYYNEPVRSRYNSNREPHNAWDRRQQQRDRNGVVSLNPNRDQKANRHSTHSANGSRVERASGNTVHTSRSEALQARMAQRQQVAGRSPQSSPQNGSSETRVSRNQSDAGTNSTINRQETLRQRSAKQNQDIRFSNQNQTESQVTRTRATRQEREMTTPREVIQRRESTDRRIERSPTESRVDRYRESRVNARNSGSRENSGNRISRERDR